MQRFLGDTRRTFTSVDLCRHAPACVFPLANSVVAACGPTVLKYQFKTSQGLSTPPPHREKHSPENRLWHNRGSQNHDVSVTWELHTVTVYQSKAYAESYFCWKGGIRLQSLAMYSGICTDMRKRAHTHTQTHVRRGERDVG